MIVCRTSCLSSGLGSRFEYADEEIVSGLVVDLPEFPGSMGSFGSLA